MSDSTKACDGVQATTQMVRVDDLTPQEERSIRRAAIGASYPDTIEGIDNAPRDGYISPEEREAGIEFLRERAAQFVAQGKEKGRAVRNKLNEYAFHDRNGAQALELQPPGATIQYMKPAFYDRAEFLIPLALDADGAGDGGRRLRYSGDIDGRESKFVAERARQESLKRSDSE